MDVQELNRTLTLLELGEEGNFLSDKYKSVALVLGTTGSGKSTFLQWMFGNNDELTSVESSDGEFIIVDKNGRISNSTIISKTLFPELVIDQQTGSAYYDCPGFSDTRSPSVDIINSLFIKRITDHATSLKIILSISYPAVRKGVDRVAFLTLVRHTVDFVKNLDNYENSIGLVVTKIDNEYLRVKGKMKFIDDDEVLKKIVTFLQAAKDDIQILKTENIKEEKFYDNAIKLINIILRKKNDEYNKIMLFGRPEEAGPLSAITLMQEAKLGVENILNYNIIYGNKNQNDFGYSISAEAKFLISGLSNVINDQLWMELTGIMKEIEQDSENSQEIFVQLINTMVKQTASASNLAKIKTLYRETNKTHDLLNYLLVNNAGTMSDIKKAMQEWNIAKKEEHLTNIGKYNSYLEFFTLVSGKPIKERPWKSLIKQATENIARYKNKVYGKVTDTLRSINNNLIANRENMANAFKESLNEKFKKLEIQNTVLEARKQTVYFENLRENINSTNTEKIEKLIIFMNNNNLNTSNIGKILYQISSNSVKRQFLCNLNPGLEQFCAEGILIDFQLMKSALDELHTWHQFLNRLLDEFSSYKFQKNKEDFVQNMGKWGISGKDQGLHVTNKNINLLIQKLDDLKIAHPLKYNAILDDDKIDRIGEVLRFTLSSKQTNCNQGKLTIRGNFLLLTELSKASCYGLKSVDMFAIDTIFIDTNINFQGREIQLNLIAPTWVVQGQASINLNGSPGNPHGRKAHSYDAGYPGNPGGSAGNFFGLAATVEGATYLSINANGGEGGRGQDGAVGKNGNHGRNANDDDSFRKEFMSDKKVITIVYNQIVAKWKYYGTAGESGGDGKDGGAGGMGGNKGRIEFIALKSMEVPKKSTLQGSNGNGGEGGNGGQGGICGDDLVVELCYRQAMGIIVQFGSECGRSVERCYSRASSGSNGRYGANYRNRDTPRDVAFENTASVFKRFKIFVWESFEKEVLNSKLLELLELAEKNNAIQTSATDLIAYEEYFDLQKHGKNMKNENLLHFLQASNNEKLANYLIASCTNNLKPSKVNFLPANIQKYLKSLEPIITLTRTDNVRTKKKIVNDLVQNYYDRIIKELDIVSIVIDKVANTVRELKTQSTILNHDFLQEKLNALEVVNLVFNYVDFVRNIAFVVLPGKSKPLGNEDKKYESFMIFLDEENKKMQKSNIKYPLIQNILPVAKNVDEMFKALSQTPKLANSLSQEITKLNVQRSLHDINFEIQIMSQDFINNEHILDQLDKLTEVSTILINTFNNLEIITGVKELAVLLTRISSQNTYLQEKLDQSLTLNINNNQNKQSFNAVKWHIFPFAQLLLQNISEPTCSSEISNYQQQLGAALQRYKSEISKEYIKNGLFTSEEPFYTWKNEFHKDKIANVFKGQKIFLRANIFSTHSMREATKINTIELFIRSKNKTMENEVNLYLQNYDVQATHFGNSHYLVNKTIYLIETDKVSIEFSVKKDQFGKPIRKNQAFDEIEKGEIILSPYAMWQLQLIPIEKSNFDEFYRFENDFDLELRGKGTYIESDNLPDLRVEKYYEELDKRSVIHLIQSNDLIFKEDHRRVRRSGLENLGFEESRKNAILDINKTGEFDENELPYAEHQNLLDKPTTSGAGRNRLFLDGMKNYLIDKIVEYFDWSRSIISNKIDSQALPKVTFFAEDSINEASVTNDVNLNETLVLGHLIIGSLLKEKKMLSNKTYLSPNNIQNLTAQSLAVNILTQINQAKSQYE